MTIDNRRLFDVSHDPSTVLCLELSQSSLQGLCEMLEVGGVHLKQVALQFVYSRRRREDSVIITVIV